MAYGDGEIIKTKFLCKTTCSGGSYGNIKERFIKGKWYDGEYETWWFEGGYKMNGGHRRYLAINEGGVREDIGKSMFKIIFETDTNELRDNKIDQILK
jgi:hypothetical protein